MAILVVSAIANSITDIHFRVSTFPFFLQSCENLRSHKSDPNSVLNFLSDCENVFPKWLYHFTGSSFSMSSPTLGIVCPFAYGHFSGCVVASHLVFICIALVRSDVKHLHVHMCAIQPSSSMEVCSSLVLTGLPS